MDMKNYFVEFILNFFIKNFFETFFNYFLNLLYEEKNGNIDKALDFIIEGCIASAKQPDPGYRWELYYNAASFLE